MSASQPWVLRGHSDTRLWIPEGFEPRWPDAEEYRYIVVDELIEEIGTLAVAPWPHVDDSGRLVFDDDAAGLHLRVADLAAFLATNREPPPLADEVAGPALDAFRARRVRIGDTFAAREAKVPSEASFEVRREGHHARLVNPVRWLQPPVYDITGQSRQAVKLMFYAAAAPVLKGEAVRMQIAEVAEFALPDPYNVIAEPEPAGGPAPDAETPQ